MSRLKFAISLAFGLCAAAAPAAAQAVRATSSEAHWRSGVIQLALKAELPDDCTRLVRATPQGVTTRTLAVEVIVVREENSRCRAGSGRVERSYSYNFPGISQSTNAIAMRFLRDGQELGRETTPINTSPSARQ